MLLEAVLKAKPNLLLHAKCVQRERILHNAENDRPFELTQHALNAISDAVHGHGLIKAVGSVPYRKYSVRAFNFEA